MNPSFAVVVGASTGGVQALIELTAALPAGFGAPLLVVQHIGELPSILPELMARGSANPVRHARHGERPAAGTIYVAPPDRHLLVNPDGTLCLSSGPKENHTRPAIDPLFRSAAAHFRERTIGVVLCGQLDDGTAGLAAVKACGGHAIVQDPATTAWPAMPRSALDNVAVDECLPLAQIATALVQRVGQPAPRAQEPDRAVVREAEINQGKQMMENLQAIATPSSLTCPDCGGGLWEVRGDRPLRWRCHTGHAFTAQSLAHAQGQAAEHALWGSVRALNEKEMLFLRVAEVARGSGQRRQEAAARAQAERVRRQADALIATIEAEPPTSSEPPTS